MYEAGQLEQGILYTTPNRCRSGVGPFGCDRRCLMVTAGLKHTRILSSVRIHVSDSDTVCIGDHCC